VTAPDTTLLIIAKQPLPGRVKTRLVPPCAHEQASALAEAALTDTLHTMLMVPARRRILVLDGKAGPWLPAGFDIVPQCDQQHVRPMDFTGRPMKGMVFVEPGGLTGGALQQWVDAAAAFTRTLPPKR
jgi:hypothetical protein